MIKIWARRTAQTAALAAGALLIAGGAAQAADDISADNDGIANGIQAEVPAQAPINVCGNAVSVLGMANAQCHGGAAANLGSTEQGQPGAREMVPVGTLPGTDTVGKTVTNATTALPIGSLPGGEVLSGLTGGLPTSGLTSGVTPPKPADTKSEKDLVGATAGQATSALPVSGLPGTDVVSRLTDGLPKNGLANGMTTTKPGKTDKKPAELADDDTGWQAGKTTSSLPIGGLPGSDALTGLAGGLPTAGVANGFTAPQAKMPMPAKEAAPTTLPGTSSVGGALGDATSVVPSTGVPGADALTGLAGDVPTDGVAKGVTSATGAF